MGALGSGGGKVGNRRTNRDVALYGWPAKADDSFVCFGAKPDKGFLDIKW